MYRRSTPLDRPASYATRGKGGRSCASYDQPIVAIAERMPFPLVKPVGQHYGPLPGTGLAHGPPLLLSRLMETLFTAEELVRIEAAALECGLSVRDWVREVALQRLKGEWRHDLEDAIWPVTVHRRPGGTLQELHHAGCWVPRGGEDTLTTAEARERAARFDVRFCDACEPERFLVPFE